MKDSTISVSVKINAQIFRDFAVFDTIRRKRRWKSPLLFALIMTASAILCFSRYQTAEQAVFMGIILLVVGFGLPAAYFVNFFRSVDRQIKKFKLAKPQPVYTVTLTEAPGGIRVVTKNGDTSEYGWDSLYGVHQGKNCVYLYVRENQAYFLPDSDVAEKSEELWNLLKKNAVPIL